MARRPNWQRFLPKGSVVTVLDSKAYRAVVIGHLPRKHMMLVRFHGRIRWKTQTLRWVRREGENLWWVCGTLTPWQEAEHALLR